LEVDISKRINWWKSKKISKRTLHKFFI